MTGYLERLESKEEKYGATHCHALLMICLKALSTGPSPRT
jgi:hypothetical protein